MDSPHIWSAGVARRSMMGKERTHNPSPAAASMLGKKTVRRAKAKLRKLGRKRAHKGNPSPALASLLGGAVGGPPGALVGGLLAGLTGGRFRAPSEVRAAKVAPAIVQAANAGNLTAAAGLIERAAKPMIAKEHAVWAAAAAQLAPAIVALVKAHMQSIPAADQSGPEAFAASVLSSPVQAPGATAGSSASQLGAYLTPQNIGAVARAVTPRRSRRQRYPTYLDRYGRQRYSTKPPGSEMRLPAGATMAAGTPYNFFSGAVGRGGAGTTAAQLGLAAAAGAAAYFGTQAILKYFGGRAVRQEEAGVQLALAARDARKEYALAHNLRGAPPTYGVPAAVIKQIGEGMKAKLAELGYNAQGVRTRSGVENFLSDYAPEG